MRRVLSIKLFNNKNFMIYMNGKAIDYRSPIQNPLLLKVADFSGGFLVTIPNIIHVYSSTH